MRKTIIRSGLESLYFSGAHMAMGPFVGGVGVILTLHHVRPPRLDPFQPNRLLEVTPAFLEDVIHLVRRKGFDIVSIDEVHRRLTTGDFSRRFVCFTIDDGYRDIAEWAYPIFRKHAAPFTLYVPTSFPDQIGELWWLALERVIAGVDRVALVMDGVDRRFDCATTEDKYATFDAIYWWLRRLDTEEQLRDAVRDLARRYGVDIPALCAELCMTWDEIAALAADPLVTIGGHTVNHVMLRKVDDHEVRTEMEMGAEVIEAALGKRPQHFAYPVGDPTSAGPREFKIAADVGFKTAVTTRAGVLHPEHRDHLMALPRISLNGEFQELRYVRVLLSGAATAVWNGFKRVHAA